MPDSLVQLSNLVWQLVRRDLSARFAGSAFGLVWALIQPLSQIALYWFVFGVMLPGGRLGIGGEGYVYFLIAGLVPWMGFNEGVMRSTTAVVDSGPLVKRLPFRSEILVLVPNLTALVFEGVALLGVVIWIAITRGLAPSIWILPIAVLVQLAMQLGFGLILSVTYVLFRDVLQVLGLGMSILFFLSPILYDVRGEFESFFRWNPLTPLIGLFRSGLLGHPLPSAGSVVFMMIATVVPLAVGTLLFRRARGVLVDLV